jgi:hypothetical protein
MPISMKIAFSKTAREHFKSQQTSSAEQSETTDNPSSRPFSDTIEPATEQTEINEPIENAILHKTEIPDEDKHTQDEEEKEKEQSPFAHLSRAELLKRIGITN